MTHLENDKGAFINDDTQVRGPGVSDFVTAWMKMKLKHVLWYDRRELGGQF